MDISPGQSEWIVNMWLKIIALNSIFYKVYFCFLLPAFCPNVGFAFFPVDRHNLNFYLTLPPLLYRLRVDRATYMANYSPVVCGFKGYYQNNLVYFLKLITKKAA